ILLLDEEQVGIAGLENPQMAILDRDVGELRPDRRRAETIAGVDQLYETLRSDAGFLQPALIGGRFGRLLLRFRLVRRRRLGLLLAPLVVLRLQALQQRLGWHIASVDPLLGAGPGLGPERPHRLAWNLA